MITLYFPYKTDCLLALAEATKAIDPMKEHEKEDITNILKPIFKKMSINWSKDRPFMSNLINPKFIVHDNLPIEEKDGYPVEFRFITEYILIIRDAMKFHFNRKDRYRRHAMVKKIFLKFKPIAEDKHIQEIAYLIGDQKQIERSVQDTKKK